MKDAWLALLSDFTATGSWFQEKSQSVASRIWSDRDLLKILKNDVLDRGSAESPQF